MNENSKASDFIDLIEQMMMKRKMYVNESRSQSILYYAQSLHAIYFDGNPLFFELPESWDDGPTYHSLKKRKKNENEYDEKKMKELIKKLELSDEEILFITSICTHYGNMNKTKFDIMMNLERPRIFR